jgi:hypothetical protein
LCRRQPRGQEVEDVDDPDPHAADACTAPALLRVHCDSFEQVSHGTPL